MDVNATLESLARTRPDRWVVDGAGVTRSEAVIPALVDRGAHDPEAGVRVLLIGGLSGKARDVEIGLQVLEHLAGRIDQAAGGPALSAVPCANPDGLRLGVGPENGAGGIPPTGYPAAEGFFDDSRDPETRYLWRWVSFHAPDVVLELRAHDGAPTWEVNEAAGTASLPVSGPTV